MPLRSLRVVGSCTATCSTLHASAPQARATTSRFPARRSPNPTRVATWAPFHMAGAAYDRKKRPCVFRTPRHHADRIITPDMGNRISTRVTVRSLVAPLNPGATTSVMTGASAMPARAAAAGRRASIDATTPARRRPASSPSARPRGGGAGGGGSTAPPPPRPAPPPPPPVPGGGGGGGPEATPPPPAGEGE